MKYIWHWNDMTENKKIIMAFKWYDIVYDANPNILLNFNKKLKKIIHILMTLLKTQLCGVT